MVSAFFSKGNIIRFGRKASLLLLAICMSLSFGWTMATTDETEEVFLKDATSALLVEASSLQVLFESEADTLHPVAGLSKLPALLVLCEAVDQGVLDVSAEISVSQRAAGISGPTAFIESGEKIKADQLLKAAVMISAGDAIVALGEHAYGSESAFMERIEIKLSELGIDIILDNATGKSTLMSPRMLAILGAQLMKSPSFTTYSGLTYETIYHADGRQTELASANKMLRTYAGCNGVLTGSSPADGYSGVFSVTRGDTHLICVVLGCKQSSARFALATEILDQAFATTRAQKLAEKGEVMAEGIRIKGGKLRTVDLVAKNTIVLLLEKTEPALLTVEDIPDVLHAPLTMGDVVGRISYQTADGIEKGSVELVCEQNIEAYGFRNIIRQIILGFLRC